MKHNVPLITRAALLSRVHVLGLGDRRRRVDRFDPQQRAGRLVCVEEAHPLAGARVVDLTVDRFHDCLLDHDSLA
jgi:hypothetical protein